MKGARSRLGCVSAPSRLHLGSISHHEGDGQKEDDEDGDNNDAKDDYDWVDGDEGSKIKLRKESKEQRKLQQQELKRKLRSDYSLILDAVVACVNISPLDACRGRTTKRFSSRYRSGGRRSRASGRCP